MSQICWIIFLVEFKAQNTEIVALMITDHRKVQQKTEAWLLDEQMQIYRVSVHVPFTKCRCMSHQTTIS
jgi:hypothetical protein